MEDQLQGFCPDENYVNIYGDLVEVVLSEDEIFVNARSLKKMGVTIMPESAYDRFIIPKQMDIQVFEQYLYDQAFNYCLNFQKTFCEDEVVNVFDRVKARLGLSSANQTGRQRQVQKQGDNITITRDVVSVRSPPQSVQNGESFYNRGRKSDGMTNQRPQKDFNGNAGRLNNSVGAQSGGLSQRLTDKRNVNQFEDKNTDVDQLSNGSSQGAIKKTHFSSQPKNDGSDKTWSGSAPHKVAPGQPRSTISLTDFQPPYELQQLTIGASYEVVVSYFLKETNFYVQLADVADKIEDILCQCLELAESQPIIDNPTKGMMCLAFFDDAWYRATVYNDNKVFLVDYGNVEFMSGELREVPENLKNIPAQAIRCTPDKSQTGTVELGQKLNIFVKKTLTDRFDNMTHIVQVSPVNTNLTEVKRPKTSDVIVKQSVAEPCFTKLPQITAKLNPGEKVIVVNFTQEKLILRNREVAEICKSVYGRIHALPKQSISNPVVGQIVLCCQEDLEGLHRAVIKKIHGKAADVDFVDCCGDITVALQSLKNIDESLAKLPPARIDQPYPALKQLNPDSEVFLTELVVNKIKVKAVLSNGNTDFEVEQNGSTILLSEKIKNFSTPKPKKSVNMQDLPAFNEVPVKSAPKKVPAPVQTTSKEEVAVATPKQQPQQEPKLLPVQMEESVKVTYDDMQYVKCDLGLGAYISFNAKINEGIPEVTLIGMTDENIERFEQVLGITPTNQQPYVPELFEMCLAFYEESWYRALCTDVEDPEFEMLFVDFGNSATLKSENLRAIPKIWSDIPILSISARFKGLPNNPKLHERLIELLPDNEQVEVDIKRQADDEDLNYEVEIPDIYETLKKEGLLK